MAVSPIWTDRSRSASIGTVFFCDGPKTTMDLRAITRQLESLEETIISHLCERAQLLYNSKIYVPYKGRSELAGASSLLDMRIRDWERVESLYGRFLSPEERPFQRDLSEPRYFIPKEQPARRDDWVNLSGLIKKAYLKLVAKICRKGDDGLYDLSMERDISALKVISRRIHIGAFHVGECKYQQDPSLFIELVAAKDNQALLQNITREEIEQKILDRVREKARGMQRETDPCIRTIVDPEVVEAFYRETIIPLTKKGEIQYIVNRVLSGIADS